MPDSGDLIWHDAAAAADLCDSTPHEVRLGEHLLALVKVGDTIFAVDCVCTHEVAMLSDGYVEDGAIECPLHSARFDLATGKVLDGPAEKDLNTYPVRLNGETVQVGLPPEHG